MLLVPLAVVSHLLLTFNRVAAQTSSVVCLASYDWVRAVQRSSSACCVAHIFAGQELSESEPVCCDRISS